MYQLRAIACGAAAAAMLGVSADALLLAAAQSKNSPVDLVQTSLALPGKVKVGQKFRILDEVESVGESAAERSVTYFYLSADDTIDDLDIVVGGRRVPPLPPGITHTERTPIILPETVKPGTYYIIAKADAQNLLEERYKDNNTKATKFTVLAADVKKQDGACD